MYSQQPCTIQISRAEIETLDCSRVLAIINSFAPELFERNRNRVDLEVMGYADDARELYDIPEVRDYFQKLLNEFPGQFYWLNTEGPTLALVMLMLYEPVRKGRMVTVSTSDFQQFLLRGYTELNAFCEHYGLSNEPSTKAIAAWLGLTSQQKP